jgi:hypothetical protein
MAYLGYIMIYILKFFYIYINNVQNNIIIDIQKDF